MRKFSGLLGALVLGLALSSCGGSTSPGGVVVAGVAEEAVAEAIVLRGPSA